MKYKSTRSLYDLADKKILTQASNMMIRLVNRSLAGIIPVASSKRGIRDDLISDALVPIGPRYYAIQHAVERCLAAGCSSIYIVCTNNIQPFIRKVTGDAAIRPASVNPKNNRFRSETGKMWYQEFVPIFYLPIHPTDRIKRNSTAWSILYGVLHAHDIARKVSPQATPALYYISFPTTVMDLKFATSLQFEISSKIMSKMNNLFLSYKGRTALNGLKIDFLLRFADLYYPLKKLDKIYRERERHVLKKNTLPYTKDVEAIFTRQLGIYKYNDYHFSLDKIFRDVNMDDIIEAPWHHSFDSWDGYCEMINSKEVRAQHRLSEEIFARRQMEKMHLFDVDLEG